MSAARPFLHRVEAGLVRALVRMMSALPIATASWVGGKTARLLGPLLPVSRKVGEANLSLAMPALSPQERRAIIRQVWENLGQTFTELANLRALQEVPPGSLAPGYCVTGWEEHVAPLLVPGKPAIFFTGHLANWEVMPVLAAKYGVDFGFMYRAASNQLVDDTLRHLRRAGYKTDVKMFAKGSAGARAAYAHLSRGNVLGLLVDQKLNTGIDAPFFGKPAKTMDALAAFALKFQCPVLPIHVRRLGPARLEVTCDPALALPHTGDKQADIAALTGTMNQTLERWVTAQPGDWLWLHRRWPKGTV